MNFRARALVCLFLVAGYFSLPVLARAKEYYINKGVKYHLGDNKFSQSEDAMLMDAYPVVGQEWIQAFTVDQDDVVHVSIEGIWGVDDCQYCKILVSINKRDMGRVTEENNHTPFSTIDPLAQKVKPGVTYYLKIASYGDSEVDDFVMDNVIVETQKAKVTLVGPVMIKNPEEPMPTPEPPPVVGDCKGTRGIPDWLPQSIAAKGYVLLVSNGGFSEQPLNANLGAGDYVEAHFRVRKSEAGNLVGQAFEVLLGDNDARSGWALNFIPGQGSLMHANLVNAGVYRAKSFKATFKGNGAWNVVRVARCPDGRASLFINGEEVGDGISGLGILEPLSLRARGMEADFSARPF
jgi:hypothetical protein